MYIFGIGAMLTDESWEVQVHRPIPTYPWSRYVIGVWLKAKELEITQIIAAL